ncbi:MAG: hypothetical protein BWY43_00422 [candidate division WS2 bacterium ADurb.Bin280]|uniref:General secretion pathway GspH domain-containing protein n=1 Tax=candidate division WS2 bacterium ADurb.Bin280 TaxID=1852829 RepID=A0A1V5SEH1_9BACT|nr:MAG: hypothetical protein BWY43_00422 [candidate division WS2 bacterium ADurb.Bin280]
MFAIIHPNRSIKGFTLVELVVTISIVLMMIVVSAPMISAGDKKKALSTAERVASFYERARNYSLNPENKESMSYKVVFDGRDQFTIVRVDETGAENALDGAQDSLFIPDSYQATVIPSNISFEVGNGKVDSPLTIKLKKPSSTSAFATIEVDENGVVKNQTDL